MHGGAIDFASAGCKKRERRKALPFSWDLLLQGQGLLCLFGNDRIHLFLEKEISQGRQAFIVCQLVEESERIDLDSAVALFERLQKEVFPQRRLALLHGKKRILVPFA